MPTDTTKNEAEDEIRVRVFADTDSPATGLSVQINEAASGLPIRVPAGQSRIVRLSKPEPKTSSRDASGEPDGLRLLLSGDDHAFDNTCYVLNPPRRELELGFLGPPAPAQTGDQIAADNLFYFLRALPLDDPTRRVKIRRIELASAFDLIDPKQMPLVVVGQAVSQPDAKRLRRYLERGGRVLVVVVSQDMGNGMATLCDSPMLAIEQPDGRNDAMLTGIRFDDPLFATLSDPRFNDFSKLRFWSHRSVSGLNNSFETLAEFDTGSPAIVVQSVANESDRGRPGRLWLMMSGWNPTQSQLALSTKFLPMMHAFFSPPRQAPSVTHVIGERLPFEPRPGSTITRPDGKTVAFETEDDHLVVDTPGFYTLNQDGVRTPFAANLAPGESETAVSDLGTLDRYVAGIQYGKAPDMDAEHEQDRQLRDIELEGRQNWWQWLLLAAVGLLAAETFWSGRPRRSEVGETLASTAS